MINKVKLNIKKLDPDAKIPTYGTSYSAGADLYALTNGLVVVKPGQTMMIKTGIACEIPEGYVGLIYARSGLACKKGLAPANKVGVIDSDYRGEIMVALHNHNEEGSEDVFVNKGDRIAQLVIMPYFMAEFNEVEELEETVRGEGGFGSTGSK